jgi:hypothetical protein
LRVGQAISIRVCISISTIGWVEAVRDFPAIWETVAIAVCIVHVGALVLFLRIGKTITVPIGATVRWVEGVRSVTTHCRNCRESKEQSY